MRKQKPRDYHIIEVEFEGRAYKGQYYTKGKALTVEYEDKVKTTFTGFFPSENEVVGLAKALLFELVTIQ